jgi:FixJ family two-component response regulator
MERRVISLVREGCSNKMVAHRIGFSEQTTKNHLTSAVIIAIRKGFIPLEEGHEPNRSHRPVRKNPVHLLKYIYFCGSHFHFRYRVA